MQVALHISIFPSKEQGHKCKQQELLQMIIVGKMEMYGLLGSVQMFIDTVSTVKTAPSDAFMKNMSYYL